jgi:hypothetical protein
MNSAEPGSPGNTIFLNPGRLRQPHAILNEFNTAFFENIQHATTMLRPHFFGDACTIAVIPDRIH